MKRDVPFRTVGKLIMARTEIDRMQHLNEKATLEISAITLQNMENGTLRSPEVPLMATGCEQGLNQ